jgi:hypothetical protein
MCNTWREYGFASGCLYGTAYLCGLLGLAGASNERGNACGPVPCGRRKVLQGRRLTMKYAAMVVLSVVIVASLSAVGCSGKSSSMTIEEFKAKIGPEGHGTLIKDLYSKVGEPEKIQFLGEEVLLYYKVREGTVQVIGDKWSWENDTAESGSMRDGYEALPLPENMVTWLKSLPATIKQAESMSGNDGKEKTVAQWLKEAEQTGDPSNLMVIALWLWDKQESERAEKYTIHVVGRMLLLKRINMF